MSKMQIHQSHLSTFSRCGEQYRRRHIQGEIIPPGVALLVGSGTHASIEANMKHKIETKKLLSLEAVKDLARDALNTRWESEGVLLDEEEKSIGEKNVKGDAVDQAVSLAALHHTELAPKIKPVSVERPWVLVLDGFPRDLAGRFDIEEKNLLRDTKTSKRSPNKTAADDSEQLSMYALAKSVLDGKIPKLRLDFLVKSKEVKAVSQDTVRTEEDLKVLMRRIEVHNDALDKGVFVPANRDSWACSPVYCGFYKTCPYVNGRKVI